MRPRFHLTLPDGKSGGARNGLRRCSIAVVFSPWQFCSFFRTYYVRGFVKHGSKALHFHRALFCRWGSLWRLDGPSLSSRHASRRDTSGELADDTCSTVRVQRRETNTSVFLSLKESWEGVPLYRGTDALEWRRCR